MKSKQEIINEFKALFNEAPHYKVLKEKHPALFENIMRNWNGYRAFLRSIKMKAPTPTPREQAFINFSSICAKRYYANGEWSKFEKEIKPIIDKICLDLGLTYEHNFKFPSMKGKGYYKFDFYFFFRNEPIKRRIECNGVFHNIGNTKERDKLIDEYLLKFGIQTLRITVKCKQEKYHDYILAFLLAYFGSGV